MTSPALSVVDTADLRKARGAFFTPPAIARYVTEWAMRSASDQVLEPSCGEAAFLTEAAHRRRVLAAVTGTESAAGGLVGVELHEASARTARALTEAAGEPADITVGDFFGFRRDGHFDAVIGNPPYVRYQEFAGTSRAVAQEAALRAGVALTGLASSWAAFTVHAATQLRTGGRMGLVLPAEIMTVNYAAAVRQFLIERFSHVTVVLFTERVFPEVLEEVVLLLADGYDTGAAGHIAFHQARNAEELADLSVARTWTPNTPGERWAAALLPGETLDVYSALLGDHAFQPLEAWGDTTLGMVTGNNKYFALSSARVAELGLAPTDVVRLSPPGSRHLRGLSFTTSALNELGKAGSSVWLFRPSGEPSEAAWRYIDAGETAGVDKAYKCRVRRPWWRVPLVPPADLLLTYMNADTPRLTTNAARAHHLNSVHGVYLKDEVRALGVASLPLASLTTMTLLGAEVVGRAYGGGMLKLEPREADRLPVPSAKVVEAAQEKLSIIRPQVGRLLRGGRLTDAAKLVDDVVLVGELGMRRGDLRALRETHAELTARRVARGSRGTDR